MSLYAINAVTLGISQYTGLSFIAVVEHDGRYYGLTETEMFEITGTTDDDVDIDCHIKTGIPDFNSPHLKYCPRAYLGYEADEGARVTTFSTDGGEDRTREYNVDATVGNVVRDGRVKLGRNTKARYWGFKIANYSGGSFAVRSFAVLFNKIDRLLG